MVSAEQKNVNQRIEVLDLRILNERHVRAECRVRIGAIIISGVRVVQPALGQPFISMPQRKSGDQWISLINVLSPTLEAEIRNAVFGEWRHCSGLEVR